MSNPQNKLGVKSIPDTTSIVSGSTTIQVNHLVTLLANTNESRRSILLTNKGISYPVWIGNLSTTTGGTGGINFTYLTVGNNIKITDYAGPLYGIHVGLSGMKEMVGVFDIG
jgi:hypothetical protein